MTQFTRADSEAIKAVLAAAGALLVIGFFLVYRLKEAHPGIFKIGIILLRSFLGFLVITAFLNYSRIFQFSEVVSPGSFRYVWRERIDSYDLIHYYLTPKYFRELNYFRLYPAIIVADLENGGPFYRFDTERKRIVFQDENDYYWVDSREWSRNIQGHEQIKEFFSPPRWQEFSHDFLYLQRIAGGGMGRSSWNQMLWDHGFNGTPAWVSLVHFPLQFVPVEALKFLGYVDALWVLLAVLCTFWAFGINAGMFFLFFFFCTYSTRWPTLTWVFGRYDYVCTLVIALGLIKKNVLWLAGLFAGWSASLRIFPILWNIGPGVKFLDGLFRKDPHARVLLNFFAGIAVSITLLWGSAYVQFGAEPISLYFKKMSAHTTPENLSSMRQGLALAAAYEGETHIDRMDDARRLKVKEQGRWVMFAGVILTVLLLFLLRKQPLEEAFAFGFLPFFFLLTASYYYYVVRSTLIVLHASQLNRFRHMAGLVMLLAIEVVSNILQTVLPRVRVAHIGWMGWMILLYSLTTMYLLAREQREQGGGSFLI